MVRGSDSTGVPSFGDVLRTPSYPPLFASATLSTWGDYIARITIASVVFSWTGSAIATAATFAVSLVPTILGRALLGPFCDRFPPRTTLAVTHLLRAVVVAALMVAVSTTTSVALVLVLVFLLEFIGGPAVTASQILLTDVFADRRLYARAFGLSALAQQVNQAIGLAVGGAIVGVLGDARALLLDLLTFLIGAGLVLSLRIGTSVQAAATASFLRDLASGWREIKGNRVLGRLLILSLASALAIAAPEAVALPYAKGTSNGTAAWGGLLMAAPILGAVLGLLLIGRLRAERQSALIMRLALLMPFPLLVTVFEPPVVVVWLAWFTCGALQSYMLPLQAAFTLLVPTRLRGRVFGLAGALSVAVTGVCFLIAGWISERTTPAAAVGISAVVTIGVLVLVAARWPREEIARRMEATFTDRPPEEGRTRSSGSVTELDGHGPDRAAQDVEDVEDANDVDDVAAPEPRGRAASGG